MSEYKEIAGLLAAEFPRESVSWRAQQVTADGKKALALAYIDARDVMNRLDDVCGVFGWQCRYTHAEAKTICEIGVEFGGQWIWKADGAGDSDIEAEKGAISDAFKRAAVKWGIGRYLYDLPAPWVPCESYDSGGKKKWSKFTADPWDYVKNDGTGRTQAARLRHLKLATLKDDINKSKSIGELAAVWTDNEALLKELNKQDIEAYCELVALKDKAKFTLQQMADFNNELYAFKE